MRRNGLFIQGIVALGIVFQFEGTGRAGTVIDQDMIDIWGKKSGFVLFYSNKRLRIDQKDGKLSTIIHFRNDRILILDHVSKTYVAYPFSSWEKQVSQRLGRQEALQKREIRVEPTGAEKKINGYHTRQIRVFIDGILFQDIWVTREVDLEEMLEAIKEGVRHLSGFSKAEIEEKEEIYHKVKKLGFPILTTEYQQVLGKTLREVTEVKRVEIRKLDSDLFAPPRAYKRRKR